MKQCLIIQFKFIQISINQIKKAMKKLFSLIAIVLVCAVTFTACSDEEVKPNNGIEVEKVVR